MVVVVVVGVVGWCLGRVVVGRQVVWGWGRG
jgi:hypothetical protein